MEMRPIDGDALWHDMENADWYNNADRDEVAELLVLRAPTIGGWISVKERLPERYERILTYDKYSGVKENWLLRSYPGVSWSYGFHVTHWMPLPEPPKEDEPNDA